MNSLSLAECCRLLAIDPKTLRQWLAQAQMAFHADPANAKIKCLDIEQVQTLARLHGRVLKPEANASALSQPFEAQRQLPLPTLPDADLRAKLAQMEAQVATLQGQLADLALQLLREREQRTEERALTVESQVVLPAFARHATERRLIPLIEYGARGRYVLIDPKAGELPITPDSPEWFEWVASLSSFRFVGESRRFSARRGFGQRPNRGWYAQRTIHQQFRGKYIGVSEHVTIARLEHIAAELQLPVYML